MITQTIKPTLDSKMKSKANAKSSNAEPEGELIRRRNEVSPTALWLGGDRKLDMGWGRGPQVLEGHELISWFFSRDGI